MPGLERLSGLVIILACHYPSQSVHSCQFPFDRSGFSLENICPFNISLKNIIRARTLPGFRSQMWKGLMFWGAFWMIWWLNNLLHLFMTRNKSVYLLSWGACVLLVPVCWENYVSPSRVLCNFITFGDATMGCRNLPCHCLPSSDFPLMTEFLQATAPHQNCLFLARWARVRADCPLESQTSTRWQSRVWQQATTRDL